MSNLIFGLSVTVIGMLIVFSGLVVLIFCVKGMNLLFGKKRKKPAPATVPAPTPVSAPAAPSAPAVKEQDDNTLAAVIAAAVAAMWQDETTGFVVRRIRRVNNASAWQKAGREEQTYSRL